MFFIKNKPLKILILINIIFFFGANMFPPVFALFVKEIGGSALAAGSIWATFAIFTGLLIFIFSHLGDKIKEKEYLVLGGYFFRLIAWIGYFFANSLWHLYVLQIILALGESMGTPAFNAIYSEHLDRGKFVKQWGLLSSTHMIVMGLSAFLGGFFVNQFGFRPLFLFMAALAGVSFVLLLVQPRKLL
jgi:MFS family permease